MAALGTEPRDVPDTKGNAHDRTPAPIDRAGGSGGSGFRLLRFALANLTRKPDRFALSVIGIALAIMVVVVVRTISAGFAASGSASLGDVLHGAPLWVVPGRGMQYDSKLAAMLPDGPAPALKLPAGWTARQTVAGGWASPAGRIALYGTSGTPAGTADLGSAAAAALHVRSGQILHVGAASLTVNVVGGSRIVTVSPNVARQVVGTSSWWTVRPPASMAGQYNLGELLSQATGIPTTTNPAQKPGQTGLIYDTVGGGGTLTFDQKFSAQFSGKVNGSVLGLVSTVGLVLGFIIGVTSFLAAVQERRREFGIMASIGLGDEILYFFLVESAVVFVIAYLAGALAAGLVALTVVPDVASVGAWLQAAGIVAAYLPVMAIIGALVPVHRLLQQRPVSLLADTA
jgi:ABC-type antimicrobial peptide transport system permease subunit